MAKTADFKNRHVMVGAIFKKGDYEMIRAAEIFGNGCVLQRNRKNIIWGTTDTKEKITIRFLDRSYETETDEAGFWKIELAPCKEGGPYTMYIASGEEEIYYLDIYFGEVWMAGGQSNMELALRDSDQGEFVSRQADYPLIRFFNVPKLASEKDPLYRQEWENACWKEAVGEQTGDMSAVAYYFARRLQESLGVPVGIIDCYWGGTSALCWMSEEMVTSDEDAKRCYEEYYDAIKDQTEEEFDTLMAAYRKEYDGWNERVQKQREIKPDITWEELNEIAGTCPWPQPAGKKSPFRPCGLYHTMVEKVIPYGIKGFIYYQGEEDWNKSSFYHKLNSMVIRQWRQDFGQGELPFYLVQLPMYIAKGEEDDKNWCILRQQQEMVTEENLNTGMAVIIDCGEFDNIHPTDKKTPGTRLALQALGKTYHVIEKYESMFFDRLQVKGNEMILFFQNTYGGIVAGDGELLGFEISSGGDHFVQADARIEGENIVVFSDEIQNPCVVRYAWTNFGKVNVYNRAGLPLAPFHTK